VSLDTKIAPLAIGTGASRRGESSDSPAKTAPTSAEGQKLARVAGEFESMLLLQMLREMRKSGSWKDEDEEKSGYGAETLFDTLDMELASYITKSKGGFGLEKSLTRQLTGSTAVESAVPSTLPSLDLPLSPGGASWERPAGPHGSAEAGSHADPAITHRVETSPFGWRRDPFTGTTAYHRGVDLRAAYGEPIGAADAGTVVFAGEQRGYGQTVVVEHGNGIRTRYAHLSSVSTEAGAAVQAGEAIGRAGRSGRATGTHLHFEVTQNGQPVDPHAYSAGGLKPEGVTADWGGGNRPTLPPGVASEPQGSGAD
jgi:murein DD-endopeptidase MepM/ murein hydrolase activator NlpD